MARPEGTIEEACIADKALTYCSIYVAGIETRFNRDGINDEKIVGPVLNEA